MNTNIRRFLLTTYKSISKSRAIHNSKKMMADQCIDKTHFVLPNNQPIEYLDCNSSFNQLTDKEKHYAHHFSQASNYSHLIALCQSSPESPLIFSLLHRVFSAEPIDELKSAALDAGATEEDFTAFLVYACGFFANAGNYRGSGDSKIVPNLDVDKFELIIKSSQAYESPELDALWSKCKKPIYLLTERTRNLGFGNEGVTTYLSENITQQDSERIKEWMKLKQIYGVSCRTFKTAVDGHITYNIKFASVESGKKDGVTMPPEEYKGHTFLATRGDFSSLLALVNSKLAPAKDYAANENQEQMLKNYIESFAEGDLNAHKDASRYWIKDLGPAVETNIGFVLRYRDPARIRGEFFGFTSMVDKEMTKRFAALVKDAEKFIALLPWDKRFEKDNYLKPDFTSIDVLSYGGSMVPAGICIPVYEDIQQHEGFKNVSLGNVIAKAYNFKEAIPFLSEADQILMKKYRVRAFEVQVGIHELLGHGSGKLFEVDENGKYNFDTDATINPLTNKLVDSWYEPGETYNTKFNEISMSYEECRAESIGLLLSLNRDILSIFGITDEQEIDDIVYVNWLSLLWAGVGNALQTYNPTTKQWLQAHNQARYVLSRVLIEAGQDFVTVQETENGTNLLLTVDRTKLRTVGRDTISDFLMKLQVYKATADAESGTKLYKHYSAVTDDTAPYTWAKWRDIVLANKKPRPIFAQANTILKDDVVSLKPYPASCEGYLESVVDRYQPNEKVYEVLEAFYEENKKFYPLSTES